MTTGLPVFDHTVQETNLWLKALMERLHTEDRQAAYLALRATLHALRDRVGPENAVHLAAQLPMLVRGLYYEGWRMGASRTKERTRAEFLEHVRDELPRGSPIDPNLAARAVFAVLWERIDSGQVAAAARAAGPVALSSQSRSVTSLSSGSSRSAVSSKPSRRAIASIGRLTCRTWPKISCRPRLRA